MNETTRILWALLRFQNPDEMSLMFKSADGIEDFAVKIKEYVESVLLEEVDWNTIAQRFAEIPFEDSRSD